MSYDLLLKRPRNPLKIEEFDTVNETIKASIPFVLIKKLEQGVYDGQVDGVVKCNITYLDETQELQISANAALAKYVDVFAALMAEALGAEIFDPQNMQVVNVDLSKIDLDKLRPSEAEKLEAENQELAVFKYRAWKLLGQVEMGLFDFENDAKTAGFLYRNSYGPVFLPANIQRNKKEKYDYLRKEFKDRFEIVLSEKDYLLIRLERQKDGTVPYMAFKKPSNQLS